MERSEFENTFLAGLPEDPILGALHICKQFRAFERSNKGEKVDAYTEGYIKAFAFLSAYVETHDLPFPAPSLGADAKDNILAIRSGS